MSLSITRDELRAAIEAGIQAANLDLWEQEAFALRAVAENTKHVAFGQFGLNEGSAGCPMVQAGLFDDHTDSKRFWDFISAFDEPLRKRHRRSFGAVEVVG